MRSISLIPQILLEVASCNFMWEVSGGYYKLVNLRKILVNFAHFRQGVTLCKKYEKLNLTFDCRIKIISKIDIG